MQKLKLDKKYEPIQVNENDEFFPNGIFEFNITKILEFIEQNQKDIILENIDVTKYHNEAFPSVNEDHIDTVDISKPILLIEIKLNSFIVVDGHQRLEKAYRKEIQTIKAYKLTVNQFIPFFTTVKGYQAFVGYWNDYLKYLADIE